MAAVVSITLSSSGTVADTPLNGIVSVQNTEAGSVSVVSIVLYEIPSNSISSPPAGPPNFMGAVIRQPDYLVPNVAPGTYPSLTASSTGNYPFSVLVPSPCMPGPSAVAPSTSYRGPFANPSGNTFCRLGCTVVVNDGSSNIIGTAVTGFPVSTVSPPFPPSSVGTEFFNAATNAVNWFFF